MLTQFSENKEGSPKIDGIMLVRSYTNLHLLWFPKRKKNIMRCNRLVIPIRHYNKIKHHTKFHQEHPKYYITGIKMFRTSLKIYDSKLEVKHVSTRVR